MRNAADSRIADPRLSRLITTVSDRHPILGKVIDTHGAASLSEYAREIRRYESYDPIQPRDEMIDAVTTAVNSKVIFDYLGARAVRKDM